MQGVGHLKSPKLRDLCPSSGIGYRGYNFFLNFMSWDKDHLLKYNQLMKYRGVSRLRREDLLFFDVVTLLKQTRELCREALSFFIVEDLVWDEQSRRFIIVASRDGEHQAVGEINRDNFEDVREVILQLNFIGIDKDEAPVRHSSEKSKELWERAQQYLKKQSKSDAGVDKPEYHLSNIVSKMCAAHPSYNLLNIYDLTVFQLYDSFFQFGYIRSADLSERIFSNHGGKNFKFEDWLKPILRNV